MRQNVRVYVPATLTTLKILRELGELVAGHGHAVTDALRRADPDADAEELAYAAYRNAARDSLDLLHEDQGAPRRRVVVAADLPVEVGSEEGSEVALPAAVPLAAVAAIHVDGAGAEAEVAAAAAVVAAAAAGQLAARRAVDAAGAHELEWFDVSELAQLVG